MSENKRAGRDKELRKKMRAALDRYESVFGKPLSAKVLNEFLDESEKRNRLTFLTDRIGVLADQDVKYLRELVNENVASPETELSVDVTEESVQQIEEIDDINLDDLSA